ncbi:unnamed protein product [Cylindrotheca closterium]|uniref:Membrane protein insertion efficiency factor n=1 Tax=Cylindrotheca closterium TaxID=2856 RepID=A0AAD2CPY1_9STRA|nr:unnamed protein product [Cylindrotheca closterium]
MISRALFSKELFSRSILKSNGGILVAALKGMTRSMEKHPAAKPMMVLGAGVILSQRVFQGYPSIPLFRSAEDEESRPTTDEDSNCNEEEDNDSKLPMTAAMVGTIGIYKNYISPLLPPACRFLPTCSQYGVQAIEEFGPTKGCVLTAWRLLRCSPFGGRGYDPPKWPPVPYNYGSY